MENPIIDPSTLTEGQREDIINRYFERDSLSYTLGKRAVMEWLFGKSMFEKGE